MWRLSWWKSRFCCCWPQGSGGAGPQFKPERSASKHPPGAGGTTSTNGNETPTAPPTTKEQVTVTAPYPGQSLPALRPDEFVNCMQQSPQGSDPKTLTMHRRICEQQLNWEKHIVVEACINSDGKAAPPRVIQACTESLDHKIFEGHDRFFLFGDRAAAYFALGDKQHALDDYNEAVKLAPHNAQLYYNRGVFYAAQSDADAALRDFETAIGIDPKQVRALRQRAKIYYVRNNYSSALADYSEAIRLDPKTAALWSDGHTCACSNTTTRVP